MYSQDSGKIGISRYKYTLVYSAMVNVASVFHTMGISEGTLQEVLRVQNQLVIHWTFLQLAKRACQHLLLNSDVKEGDGSIRLPRQLVLAASFNFWYLELFNNQQTAPCPYGSVLWGTFTYDHRGQGKVLSAKKGINLYQCCRGSTLKGRPFVPPHIYSA